jgi:hypothetical protein
MNGYCVNDIVTGFGLVIRFTERLRLITTINSYTLTILHISHITLGHPRFSQSSLAIALKRFPMGFVALSLGPRTVTISSYMLLISPAHND